MDRVNMSVAIIPWRPSSAGTPSSKGRYCPPFFVGYLLTQVLGGRLADRFGGKIVLGIGVLSWSFFTLITPLAAAAGFAALLAARIGMGVGEGVTFPSIYSLFGRWLPKAESARGIGVIFLAIPLGSVFALLATPFIVVTWGWHWAFYSFGAIGMVWWWFWYRHVSAHPDAHPTIGAHERAELDTIVVAEESRPPSLRELLGCMPGVGDHRRPLLHELGQLRAARVDGRRTSRQGLGVDLRIGRHLLGGFLRCVRVLFMNVAGWSADRLIKRGWDVTTGAQDDADDRLRRCATRLMFVGYIPRRAGRHRA
jgi:ACS family sodium-dependent inorganic phosphate cotransporter